METSENQASTLQGKRIMVACSAEISEILRRLVCERWYLEQSDNFRNERRQNDGRWRSRSGGSSWTIGNYALSQEQMNANALEVYKYLSARGWSLNAIAGLLGNMQSESYVNPGVWQSLQANNYSGGFGLVQWTPATNYTDWARQNGYDIADPNGQLYWIDALSETTGQWIPTSAYNMSWSAFKKSGSSPEDLASAFLKNFERAGVEVESNRRSQARSYFNLLGQYGKNAKAVESAVQWAIGIANDNSHGYDQGSRWGPDYDCSSLLITAYQQAGIKVKDAGATYTGNMYSAFLACGFEDVTGFVNLSNGSGIKRGDILLNTASHTAMSIGNGQVVQASQNELGGATGGQSGDQTGREIWCTNYYNFPWNYVLRLSHSESGGSSGGASAYIVKWIPG